MLEIIVAIIFGGIIGGGLLVIVVHSVYEYFLHTTFLRAISKILVILGQGAVLIIVVFLITIGLLLLVYAGIFGCTSIARFLSRQMDPEEVANGTLRPALSNESLSDQEQMSESINRQEVPDISPRRIETTLTNDDLRIRQVSAYLQLLQLQLQQRRLPESQQSPRYSMKQLELLDTFDWGSRSNDNNNHDTMCVICQNHFELDERITLFPECKHEFHTTCLSKWLMNSASTQTCPTCRGDLHGYFKSLGELPQLRG